MNETELMVWVQQIIPYLKSGFFATTTIIAVCFAAVGVLTDIKEEAQ